MSEPYSSQLHSKIIDRFRQEVGDGQKTAREMAVWAVHLELWDAPIRSKVDQLTKELSVALRSREFTDAKGRKVKAYHRVTQEGTAPDGTKQVQTVWAHIDVATHKFIEESLRQTRKGIVAVAVRSETVQDHWNEYRRGENPPIKISWSNIQDDLNDAKQSTEYQPELLSEEDLSEGDET